MIGFVSPEVLWLLLLVVPLAAAVPIASWVRRRRLRGFATDRALEVLDTTASPRRRFHKTVLLIGALVFSILAAARPYWGMREREVSRAGVDLIIGIDVSASMLSTDASPSRLEVARQTVRRILAELPGQRVALMPFAGEAFIQCPLTLDYGMALNVLRKTGPDSIGRRGTNVPAAIETAIEAFKRSSQGTRVLLLFTDAESHEGDVAAAAQEAAREGIHVYVVGIGTTEGAPIRNADGSLMEDREGIKVTTRLDTETLKKLALETKGQAYIMAPDRPFDSGPLVASIQSLAKGDLGTSRRTIPEERYQWFLAVALLLLLLEAAIGERRRGSAADLAGARIA